MIQRSAFFPDFHRAGLGRKPQPAAQKLARQIRELDTFCIAHLQRLFGTLIGHLFSAWRKTEGKDSRRRCFTPEVTFWAFLAQVLDPDSSCRRALSRVQSLSQSRRLKDISDSTSAYCQARSKLSIRLLFKILHVLTDAVQRTVHGMSAKGRVIVIDGTSVTVPDTDANRSAFGYAQGQKKGIGFPSMKLLGMFDLGSGACLHMARSQAKVHDATIAERLVGRFKAGDIVVADRAFCSYSLISKLVARGVHVVMRLHQSRAAALEAGRKGKAKTTPADVQQEWKRPGAISQRGVRALRKKRARKARIKAHQQRLRRERDQLPAQMKMRVITHVISIRGHRPKAFHFATTLLDSARHSDAAIAALYLRRWEIELFFDDIKTSQSMEMLRTHSPHMVARELLMHRIAYNLARLLMGEAEAKRPAGQPGRLSFRGTLDRISQSHSAMWGAERIAEGARRDLVERIAADVVPYRPGRREPRQLKRRPKNYQLMTQPRQKLRARPEPPKRSLCRAA